MPQGPCPRPALARLKAALIVGLALPFATQWALAAALPIAAPAEVGLSVQRLERLTAYMNQAVADGTMVGGSGLIARDGKIAYHEVYGLADREARRPMTTDAIFRIYSMSKPITSVAVMMLHEEGRFVLNEPVARYLPALADLRVATATADGTAPAATSDGTVTTLEEGEGEATPPALETRQPKRQPTIRDLLRHTAGFTYGVFGNSPVDALYREAGLLTEDMALMDFVAKLGQIPLQYDPGSRWHYSVSVDVQGALVEAVSGMPFGGFLKQRLFDPLGMVDTRFTAPESLWPRIAQLYSPAGTPGDVSAFRTPNLGTSLVVADDRLNQGYREGALFESGGGGLLSTSSDYLRFCQMLLNGGELDGVRILSPKSVALMSTDHLAGIEGFGNGAGFGLGFSVVLDPGAGGELASKGTYAWGGAAGTTFWIDPRERLIAIFMTQSIPHRTDLRSKFRPLVYQAVVESAPKQWRRKARQAQANAR